MTMAIAALASVPGQAEADTAPPPGDPRNPATASVNALPTVQIGQGVVWSQAIIGNTVYVGGQFSTARPAGSPAGTNQVTRSNLLAYDIRTGVLSTAWAPSANGAVDEVVPSPDGKRVYVGGSFTTINGTTRRRIAALDAVTGALIANFNPNADSRVRDIAVTGTAVYFGGHFGSVGGQTRSRLAATRVSDGALLPWAPNAQGGSVRSMEASPDGSQILVAGQFTTMNGSGNPGYGLASLHPVSGANLPWAANASLIRNAGPNSALTDLTSDGASVYGTGFHFGSGGTLEGTVKMSWNGGTVEWIEDCHGDVYGVAPIGEVIYTVGHAHYCGNVPGGFSQPTPWKHYRALAYSRQTTGVLRPDYLGYPSFAGQPAPAILHWFPDLSAGSFTGQTQAAWTISGNADYVVAGGEFPRVNGVNQQGLVRFARVGVANNPNNRGPDLSGANANPTVTSHGAGEALISWRTNVDRDNRNLTYKVIRGSAVNSPIHTTTAGSNEWDKRHLSFLDTGQTPGSTQSYRIFATDPFGNESRSNAVSVTISAGSATDAYARAVMEDGPMHYWRLGESSGATARDWTGRDALTLTGGVTRNAAGAIPGNAAATWNGTSAQTAYNSTAAHGPFWFSVETWFRTTSSAGGKIVGFGDLQTGSSGTNTHDRHLYMDGLGRINFGTRQSTYRTVRSPASYRDGQWHHAVGVVGDDGMSLYLDGVRVANRTDTQTARSFTGYWRVGGDSIGTGWPNRPTSSYFAGSIDEVAVYTHVLTGNDVREHFLARSGTVLNSPPTAAFTASANGLSVRFDSAASGDVDGTVESFDWDFGDGGSSAAANPTHGYALPGTYPVTLTVTDDDGAAGSVTRQVTTTVPSSEAVLDTFNRSVANGWGAADVGGGWTTTGPASRFAVSGGRGKITLTTAGAGPWVYLNGVSEMNTNAVLDVATNVAPTGSGIVHSLAVRRVGTTDYRSAVRLLGNGSVQVSISRVVGGAETKLGTATVPGLTYAAGDDLRARFTASGASPTTLTAKVWRVGAPEPAATHLSRTDSTAGLQGAGSIGMQTYVFSSVTTLPVVASFDNLSIS